MWKYKLEYINLIYIRNQQKLFATYFWSVILTLLLFPARENSATGSKNGPQFIYGLRKLWYTASQAKWERQEKMRARKIAPRDSRSIAPSSISHRIRQIYRDSRGRTYRRAPLIRSRVILSSHRAHTCSRTRTDPLRSHRLYKNSERTEWTSRIHSAILIARSLVLPGMRKLTFLRIVCETHTGTYLCVCGRGIGTERDSAVGMRRAQRSRRARRERVQYFPRIIPDNTIMESSVIFQVIYISLQDVVAPLIVERNRPKSPSERAHYFFQGSWDITSSKKFLS